MPSTPTPISPILWLWIPTTYVALQLIAEHVLPAARMEEFVSETGLIELMQFITAFCGFIVAAFILRRLEFKADRFLFAWVSIAALGLLYIAGEEVSWGQWFFYWDTPEIWAAINDQRELNLHNTSSWLDQKPRSLLEIGVIVGGLILPLIQRKHLFQLPSWLKKVSATDTVIVTALLFTLVKLIDFYGDLTGQRVFIRASEVRELLVYYFLFIYLLWLQRNLAFMK